MKYLDADYKLKKFWTILRGAPFLPMQEGPFLQSFGNYFKSAESYVSRKFVEPRDDAIRNNFKEFISYLQKYYFSRDARFSIPDWTHFSGSVPETLITTNTTNMMESMNHSLKSRFPSHGIVGLSRR